MLCHFYKSCQFLMCDILTWKNSNHLDRHNREQGVGGREVEEKISNVSKKLLTT